MEEGMSSLLEIRLGEFRLDLGTGELRTKGRRILLGEQPRRILGMLIRRPGKVITREEIQNALWPKGEIVEYEHSINAAIRRLRETFGDSSTKGRYVETVRGRGYRLVAPMSETGRIGDVAVLPFDGGGDPEMEFFSDRLTETITAHVATLPGLRVVPHQAVLSYRGRVDDFESIGRTLSAGAVVTGRALMANGNVVVAAELIDAPKNSQMWGGRFRRLADNLCEVRRLIALEIFDCLRRKLSNENSV
jgi:DNA-binding winged helix-turn-helix (wHTH) protein